MPTPPSSPPTPPSATLSAVLAGLLVRHTVSALLTALSEAVRPSTADIAGALDSAAATVSRMEARRARG